MEATVNNSVSEKFFTIPGLEGLYEISKEGTVRSIPSPKGHIGRKRTGDTLKQVVSRAGYYCVALRRHDKSQSSYFVHRLLAITFIPNPENKPTVNHKNSIRTDNRLSNLEWATYSENNKHAHEFGNQIVRTGEQHHQAKLTQDDVLNIRKFYSQIPKLTLQQLADTYGVTRSVIHAIIHRRTWKHL